MIFIRRGERDSSIEGSWDNLNLWHFHVIDLVEVLNEFQVHSLSCLLGMTTDEQQNGQPGGN